MNQKLSATNKSKSDSLRKFYTNNFAYASTDLEIVYYQTQEEFQEVKTEKGNIESTIRENKQQINSIMLIDDDELSHLITKKIIYHATNGRVEVFKFVDSRSALAYLSNDKNSLPDLILLDIEMPKMDGWDFLEAFEKLCIGVPISILTNSIRPKDHFKATKYNSVHGFWSKPLKVEQVGKILSV